MPLTSKTPRVPQKRKRQKPDNPPRTTLAKRLLYVFIISMVGSSNHDMCSAGKGALARYGKYWYPVRLIFKDGDGWEVKWWRGNDYNERIAPANKVSNEDLCDELWANSYARRQIQVLFPIVILPRMIDPTNSWGNGPMVAKQPQRRIVSLNSAVRPTQTRSKMLYGLTWGP